MRLGGSNPPSTFSINSPLVMSTAISRVIALARCWAQMTGMFVAPVLGCG